MIIKHRVVMWLEGIQFGMDIYIVRNGAVIPYLRDGLHRNAQLPVLPPEVTRIDVTWVAEDDVVKKLLHNSAPPFLLWPKNSMLLINKKASLRLERRKGNITTTCLYSLFSSFYCRYSFFYWILTLCLYNKLTKWPVLFSANHTQFLCFICNIVLYCLLL